jgi:hypothetical protein
MRLRWGAVVVLAVLASSCRGAPRGESEQIRLLDANNPIRPLPDAPRGLNIELNALSVPTHP